MSDPFDPRFGPAFHPPGSTSMGKHPTDHHTDSPQWAERGEWPVYASVAELGTRVGYPVDDPTAMPQYQEQALRLALVMASRLVDRRIGYDAPNPYDPAWYAKIKDPIVVHVVPVDPGIRMATLVVAARAMKTADLSLGVTGGLGDLAVRVWADVPEAELWLLGLRHSWGVA